MTKMLPVYATMPTTGKPKLPLNAHNLFFLVEHKRILDGTDKPGLQITPEEIQCIVLAHKRKAVRSHRRSHGKIGFRELSDEIALRWKVISLQDRQVLEEQVKTEKQNYREQLEAWKAQDWLNENSPIIFEKSKETNAPKEARRKLLDKGNCKIPLFHTKSTMPSNHWNTSDGTRLPQAFPVTSADPEDTKKATNLDSPEVPLSQVHCVDSCVGSSHHQPSSPLQFDIIEMISSAIFREAKMAGIDLLEPIDSHEMDNLFK
jgi:hypothetical protein